MPANNEPRPKLRSNRKPPSTPAADRNPFSGELQGNARSRAVTEAGGEKFLAATAVLDRLPRAVRPNSRAASRLNAEIRAAEAKTLRGLALTQGMLLDGEQFEERWRAQGEMGGSENDIWYDETTGLVWKRNRIDVMHVSWRQFFDRMLLHNAFFPEAPLRFEGFVDSDAGLCPVFTQPDVHAVRGATRNEVEQHMRIRSYQRHSGDDYCNRRLLIEDLHDGNVLVDTDGEIHVIDPVIFATG
jgi:hypothetical protein